MTKAVFSLAMNLLGMVMPCNLAGSKLLRHATVRNFARF
jgi:hypothetical protein